MVDESAEAIVARLKAEGQLTRNSGTNSLKSLKNVQEQTNEKVSAVFEKMTNLFESIDSSLLLQSSMLESLYNIQSDAYVMEKERIADEKRARLENSNLKIVSSRELPNKKAFSEYLSPLFWYTLLKLE